MLYMLYIKHFLSLIYIQYTIIHNKIKNLRTFSVPHYISITQSKPIYYMLYMLYIKHFLSLIYIQYTIIHNKIKNLRTFSVPHYISICLFVFEKR